MPVRQKEQEERTSDVSCIGGSVFAPLPKGQADLVLHEVNPGKGEAALKRWKILRVWGRQTQGTEGKVVAWSVT